MPDHTGRLHEAKSSPEASRELMLRIRRSNVQLGDGRIKVELTVHSCADTVLSWDGRDDVWDLKVSCFLAPFHPWHVFPFFAVSGCNSFWLFLLLCCSNLSLFASFAVLG